MKEPIPPRQAKTGFPQLGRADPVIGVCNALIGPRASNRVHDNHEIKPRGFALMPPRCACHNDSSFPVRNY